MIPHIVTHRLHSNDPRLKRHIVHDPRSRDFPADKAAAIHSVIHAPSPLLPVNQKQIGACTAFSSVGALLCDPYTSRVKLSVTPETTANLNKFALGLYHDETELNPQDGVYKPADPGGSGLAIAKVLKNRGLITGYSHAFGIEHALLALTLRPVIFGVTWYNSFFTPNGDGLIEIAKGSAIDGGHEICANLIDKSAELVGFIQSWGKWGVKKTGQFFMSFDTLDRLLKNQGDCTQFKV